MSPRITAEIREVLDFLQTLWGALSGLSVLFPFSNQLVKAVPLASWEATFSGGRGFAHIPPSAVTMLATVSAIFAIVVFVVQRHLISRVWTPAVTAFAVAVFLASFAALWFYFQLYFGPLASAYIAIGGYQLDPIGRDLAMLVLYCVFFSGMTAAFTVLGVREFAARR